MVSAATLGKSKSLLAAILCALLLTGCAGMSDTGKRVGGGTVAGAAGGSIVGAIAGNAALGAGIGAGVGLVGGYLYDRYKKSQDAAYRRGRRDARLEGSPPR